MLEREADRLLARCKIAPKAGQDPAEALAQVKLAILTKLVAQAVDAQVQIDYRSWCRMSELERALWEQARVEQQQQYWSLFATATGNTAMARRAMHMHDAAAQEEDAIEIGLSRTGLLN